MMGLVFSSIEQLVDHIEAGQMVCERSIGKAMAKRGLGRSGKLVSATATRRERRLDHVLGREGKRKERATLGSKRLPISGAGC